MNKKWTIPYYLARIVRSGQPSRIEEIRMSMRKQFL